MMNEIDINNFIKRFVKINKHISENYFLENLNANEIACGNGDSHGKGYGHGSELFRDFINTIIDIKTYNGQSVYHLDNKLILFDSIKYGTVGKIRIIDNLSLVAEDSWIYRYGNYYYIHKDLKIAKREAIKAYYHANGIEHAVSDFRKKFNMKDKYKAEDFYEWHAYITQSCEEGREKFTKDNNISFDDYMTVNEFLDLTRNTIGGDIIKLVEKLLH